MEQLSFLGEIDKTTHGATWWAGNWECRNHNGYFQSREGGRGPWQFYVNSFGNHDCEVAKIVSNEKLKYVMVPITERGVIEIEGKRYSRDHWQH